MEEKKSFKKLVNKAIVTRDGKKLGSVKDITFETKSGELINIIAKDLTLYIKNLNVEKINQNEALIPFNSVVAVGDFVIISEEDLM